MALSAKQRAFVECYLQCWNASEAARRAGYSEKTAGSQGARLLKNVEVDAAVKARIEELKMSADEVLLRLADQARSTMADFVNAELETVDLAGAKKAGKLHLVKKFSRTTSEKSDNVSIELYDAQAALVQLGRAHGLFKDVSETTLTGIPETSADDWSQAWLTAQKELEQWRQERFGDRDGSATPDTP